MGVAEHQAANVAPPRRGETFDLAVDATARSYDLRPLNLAGYIANDKLDPKHVFLSLQAVDGDVWIQFSPEDPTVPELNPATVITAGDPLVSNNEQGYRIPQNAELQARINRAIDRFMIVRTTMGTATLSFYASSETY